MSKRNIVRTVLAIVIVAFACLLMLVGGVSATLSDKALELHAGLTDNQTIQYSDIVSVEYRDSLKLGSRSFGVSNLFIDTGTFRNDEFGNYRLFANKNVGVYVVIRHNGGTSVYNLSDEAATKASFDALKGKFGK